MPTMRIRSLLLTLIATTTLAETPAPKPPELRRPLDGPSIIVSKPKQLPAPGDTSYIARNGSELLAILPGVFDRQTLESQTPLATVRNGQFLRGEGVWSIGMTGDEPRAPLGEKDPYVVISGPARSGGGTNPLHAAPLSQLLTGAGESSALALPTGMKSPLVVRSGIRLFATGYEYTHDTLAGQPANGLADEDSPALVIYSLAGTKPQRLAMIRLFSDHAENNLAAAVTPDGMLHLLAAEVVMSTNNQARMHHLRFDPAAKKWLGDEIVWSRTDFTSAINPKLALSADKLDAFWLADGGEKTLPTDGLYTQRFGETALWRLTDARGEYAILPDADGKGSLLVGVALHPSEDGKLRWFVRRNNEWRTAGDTDLGAQLATNTIDGTEPFALWRDAAGNVHGAFNSLSGLQLIDIALPK